QLKTACLCSRLPTPAVLAQLAAVAHAEAREQAGEDRGEHDEQQPQEVAVADGDQQADVEEAEGRDRHEAADRADDPALLLLALEPPFGKRDVQLARRRLAKVWHPDLAPPGKQFEHERHLKAINEAADQLERLAEGSRGGKVSRNAVKVSAAAARAARAEAGRRAYEAEQRAREHAADRAKNDPLGG